VTIQIDRNIHNLSQVTKERERGGEEGRSVTDPGYSNEIGGVSLQPPARSMRTGEVARETLE
jgi:hypothetical protein